MNLSWDDLVSGSLEDLKNIEQHRSPLRCGRCGRFTRTLTLVWSSGPEPEPDYEVGECCRR